MAVTILGVFCVIFIIICTVQAYWLGLAQSKIDHLEYRLNKEKYLTLKRSDRKENDEHGMG